MQLQPSFVVLALALAALTSAGGANHGSRIRRHHQQRDLPGWGWGDDAWGAVGNSVGAGATAVLPGVKFGGGADTHDSAAAGVHNHHGPGRFHDAGAGAWDLGGGFSKTLEFDGPLGEYGFGIDDSGDVGGGAGYDVGGSVGGAGRHGGPTDTYAHHSLKTAVATPSASSWKSSFSTSTSWKNSAPEKSGTHRSPSGKATKSKASQPPTATAATMVKPQPSGAGDHTVFVTVTDHDCAPDYHSGHGPYQSWSSSYVDDTTSPGTTYYTHTATGGAAPSHHKSHSHHARPLSTHSSASGTQTMQSHDTPAASHSASHVSHSHHEHKQPHTHPAHQSQPSQSPMPSQSSSKPNSHHGSESSHSHNEHEQPHTQHAHQSQPSRPSGPSHLNSGSQGSAHPTTSTSAGEHSSSSGTPGQGSAHPTASHHAWNQSHGDDHGDDSTDEGSCGRSKSSAATASTASPSSSFSTSATKTSNGGKWSTSAPIHAKTGHGGNEGGWNGSDSAGASGSLGLSGSAGAGATASAGGGVGGGISIGNQGGAWGSASAGDKNQAGTDGNQFSAYHSHHDGAAGAYTHSGGAQASGNLGPLFGGGVSVGDQEGAHASVGEGDAEGGKIGKHGASAGQSASVTGDAGASHSWGAQASDQLGPFGGGISVGVDDSANAGGGADEGSSGKWLW